MATISLLGERTLRTGSGPVRLRSSRTIALVAFLVVHAGSPQSRQHLATLFWPDSTDEQALTNLRRELHHVRAALGDEPALAVTARDLCWRDTPTCRVDVREFLTGYAAARAATDPAALIAHATTAVQWYGGELLPGGYDDWLLAARAELEDRCVELFDRLTAARAQTGDLEARPRPRGAGSGCAPWRRSATAG